MSVSPFPLPPGTISAAKREEIIAYITSPAYANDLNLEQQIAVIAALAAATPAFTTSDSIPDSASVGDRWIDSSANYQEKVCVTAYLSGAGDTSDWQDLHDSEAKSAADVAQSTANTATQLTISNDPPDGYTQSWTWVDSNDSNQTYVCVETYSAGLSVSNRLTKFEKTADTAAQLLAAAAQGTADSKTETYYQATSPESADAADRWADTDNSNATYICTAAYDKADWDANLGGEQTAFANRDLYGDSFWTEVNDATARATATSATALATLKSATFRDVDYPEAASVEDGFLNTTTDQLYICNETYTAALPSGSREFKWDRSQDPVAYARADAAFALADGKIETYVQADQPDAADYKDQWFDSDDGYKLRICNNTYTSGNGLTTDWDLVEDTTKSANFHSDEIPPAGNLSDLWVDTNDDNKTYVCIQAYTSGGAIGINWQPISDNKKVNYYSAGPPVAADMGDGWIDTDTNAGDFQFYLCSAPYTGGAHSYVDETSTGVWKAAKDQEALSLGSSAFSLADQKSSTFYSPSLPDAADLGDQWVDTDATYEDTGLNKAYICIDGYTSGNGTQLKWTEYADPVAMKTATDAQAAADAKRSVYRTGDTSPATGWPGPDGGAGGIPIATWAALGGAEIGDIWINIHPTTDEVQQRVCVEAYSGYDLELGSTANWIPLSEDGLFYTEYLSKTNAAAQTVVSDVTFSGTTISVANALEALYGGSITVPGVPPSAGSAANKKYVLDQIDLLIGGAPGTLDTLNEIAASINDDNAVWTTLNNLITPNTSHRNGDGSDHANVALNDTHRGYTANNPHNTSLTMAATAQSTTAWTSQGDITAPSFNVSSLRALKENIEEFTGDATELLMGVTVSSFNYKSDETKDPRVGLIADDEEPIITKNNTVMDIHNLIGFLIKGFQELNAKVDAING